MIKTVEPRVTTMAAAAPTEPKFIIQRYQPYNLHPTPYTLQPTP